MKDLSIIRRSAVEIFALSLLEVFPDVQLLGGAETTYGFLYECNAPFVFQDPLLHMIEERMRSLIKRDLPLEHLEMVPQSAEAFFEHQNQIYFARRAREYPAQLVPIVRIGGYASIGAGPHLRSTGEMEAFKLIKFKTNKEKTRIYCAVYRDSKELKNSIKRTPFFSEKSHVEWGRELDLFSPSPFLEEGNFVWHPEGVALLERLKKVIPCQQIVTPGTSREERLGECVAFAQAHSVSSVVEWLTEKMEGELGDSGLLDPKKFSTDVCVAVCEERELSTLCFSFLQLIIKILKMLSFEFKVVLRTSDSKKREAPLRAALMRGAWEYLEEPSLDHTPRIEWIIADGEGRYWKNSTLELVSLKEGRKKTVGITCSVFDKIERTLALLLESRDGEIPFWLSPKQLWILVVDEEARSYARRLGEEWERAGYRIEVIETLKGRLSAEMHEGLKRKVPYLVVVGKRESKTETVTVRERNREEKETMKGADFFEILKSREGSL